MKIEAKLIDYIARARYEDLPDEVRDLARFFFLNILGTTVGGARTEEAATLVGQVKEWGGSKEATILLYGGRVPAQNAAFVNSYMARALESDDGVRPGMHVGAAAVPTALAAAELAGGCRGKEFLTALVTGAEVAGRVNSSAKYNGFCPTGSCAIFATTIAAGKILGLSAEQLWNALGIAYLRSGGSAQGHREGTLSIRLVQSFIAQEGLLSARLARTGMTGPKDFLEGALGFFSLFSGGNYDPEAVTGGLGQRFDFFKTMFKKYPSCGSTISSTEAALDLIKEHEDITPDNIERVSVKLTPYSAKIVDSPFRIGAHPRLNAQYSVRYCVANALLRKSSRLEDFEEAAVRDPKITDIIQKIEIVPDPALDKRDETAVDMEITTRDGKTYTRSIDIAGGFPERPLSKEERMERFLNYIRYGEKPLAAKKVEKILATVNHLEDVEDVRRLIPLLLW